MASHFGLNLQGCSSGKHIDDVIQNHCSKSRLKVKRFSRHSTQSNEIQYTPANIVMRFVCCNNDVN